jgi:hypothetical protein
MWLLLLFKMTSLISLYQQVSSMFSFLPSIPIPTVTPVVPTVSFLWFIGDTLFNAVLVSMITHNVYYWIQQWETSSSSTSMWSLSKPVSKKWSLLGSTVAGITIGMIQLAPMPYPIVRDLRSILIGMLIGANLYLLQSFSNSSSLFPIPSRWSNLH